MMWRRRREAEGDEQIVARVIAGERDAYATLVDRHQELLYSHARAMGIDHDAAVDLVQDAFVKAYTAIRDCKEPTHFRAWVFRILRNLCLDHLKNVRRSTVPLSALPGADNLPARDDPEFELASTLQRALASLAPSLREAFLLKHDSGYTYEEIAELMDATPSAVKMRVHRARETLQEFLIENGVTAA